MSPLFPDATDGVLWEGPLEPEFVDAVEHAQRDIPVDADAIAEVLRSGLPVARIGIPSARPLLKSVKGGQVPPFLQSLLDVNDFYVVRLSCGFRLRRNDAGVEWARFRVQLAPDSRGRQPLAYDQDPKLIVQKTTRTRKIKIDPSIKFEVVESGPSAEASLGSSEWGYEYDELQPEISAEGIGQDDPLWDFKATRGTYVEGDRCMLLTVQAPKNMPSGRATLSLTADVQARGFRVPVILRRKRQEQAEPIIVKLWG